MVLLNRIYTRTGDAGSTRLASGESVSKTHPRVAAYGAVDETNAALGLARLHTATDARLDSMLTRVQNDLFDLGADLATPERGGAAARALRIVEAQVDALERDIDILNADLSELTSFVLPGGSAASAYLHLARTICRRAEREVIALAETDGEAVAAPAIKYLNRLSDLLFVAARWANDLGRSDVLWAPGAGREG